MDAQDPRDATTDVARQTSWIGAIFTGATMLVGVARESGLTLPIPQPWITFLTDYRTIAAMTTVATAAAAHLRTNKIHRLANAYILAKTTDLERRGMLSVVDPPGGPHGAA